MAKSNGPKAGFSTSKQRDKTTHFAAAIILSRPFATEPPFG